MTALNLLKNRAGASWLFLVAATVVSWAVGAEHGTGSWVAVLVLGIAAIKVRLVGLDFMELRHAPIPLRAACHRTSILARSPGARASIS